jgi:hypothetical protein
MQCSGAQTSGAETGEASSRPHPVLPTGGAPDAGSGGEVSEPDPGNTPLPPWSARALPLSIRSAGEPADVLFENLGAVRYAFFSASFPAIFLLYACRLY